MAAWKYACKTLQGMNLDLKLIGRDELPLRLTRAVSGSGNISPTQLMGLTGVINPVQELQLLDVIEHIDKNRVMIPIILGNADIKKKYDMYQIGIYAEDPDLGEILYIILQSEGAEEIPSGEEMKDFKLEWYINMSVSNADNIEVIIDETGVLTIEQGDARYVSLILYEDTTDKLNTDIKNNKIELEKEIAQESTRATEAENELQRIKLDKDGDASDVVVKFSEAEQLNPMSNPDKLSKLLGISAKAVSSLIAHLEDFNNPHKVSREKLAVDKTDNTSDMDKPVSTAQQSALDALYQQMTAYTRQKISELVNGAPAALDTIKELADAIANHKSIMDALNEAIGKKANEAEFDSHVKDTEKHITDAERTKWNEAESKKHDHQNKTILDGITSALIEQWNGAVTHISDAVKHITATERDKWNNGSHNYGTCSTATATAAKAVACNGFKLATGAEITVKFTVTNTAANPTLNVNGTGAKAIYYRGSAIAAGYLAANRTYDFRYNGSQWDLVGDIDTNTNTTYSDMKGATASADGAAGLVPKPVKGAANRYLRSDGTWNVPPDTDTKYSAGAQLALSGTTFKLAEYCTKITDWNSAKTNGWYMADGGTNAPVSGWIYGIVIAHNAKYVRQVVFHFATDNNAAGNNCDRFERVMHNESWGSWVNTSVRKAVPSNAVFTDTNNAVTQTNTPSANANYRILMSATADDTTKTEGARKDADLTYNPSTNTLTAKKVNADTADSTVTFSSGDAANPTGWANVDLVTSGEKFSSLIRKFSLFGKNVRYLWKILGSTSLSGVGDGTVTGAISSINSNLIYDDVSVSLTVDTESIAGQNIIIPEHKGYTVIGAMFTKNSPYYNTSITGNSVFIKSYWSTPQTFNNTIRFVYLRNLN